VVITHNFVPDVFRPEKSLTTSHQEQYYGK
jgi:hypothetical protein